MRVLIVDAEGGEGSLAALAPAADDISLEHATRGRAALEQLHRIQFDAVVLNLALPDMPGAELIRKMRAALMQMPILFLSDLGRTQARSEALDAGADDFIMRPVATAELTARLEALVRRREGRAATTLRVGPLVVHRDSREVLVNGRPVRLTGKEYACVELLALRKGQTLTKDAFVTHLYGGFGGPDMKIIDVFVCKLRRKLLEAGAGVLIDTVWGRGYIMREPSAASAAPRPDVAHGAPRGGTAAP